MLITCPECEKKISDRALVCPGCGFPVNEVKSNTIPDKNIAKKRSDKKKMRLPNGFGRITEIKNKNLRNPFRVMVTTGVDEFGRPVGKLLKPKAYFRTYNEAYQALMEYNKDPFDLSNKITIETLYKMWLSDYEKNVGNTRLACMKSAWAYTASVRDLDIRSVKPSQLKDVLENGEKVDKDGNVLKIRKGTSKDLNTLFAAMFDYAIEKDYIDKNPARLVKNSKVKENEEDKDPIHSSYTDEEIANLFSNEEDIVCMFVLIQCYSGWRPSELLNIETNNVDIENWTFTGGMKTEYGKNRTVPIHSKIRPLVLKKYNEAKNNQSKYLFARSKDCPMSYSMINNKYLRERGKLGISSHKLHDGRVTFVTKAKDSNVDEYAIKRIVGHSIADITERVYTKRSIEWLRDQIEKIK